MKLRYLFMINLFFAIFFGASCSLFPRWVFQLYGLAVDDAARWVTRLVGGSILGFATLMWFGRQTASVEARRAIALALLVQDAIGCIASIAMQLTGKVDALDGEARQVRGTIRRGRSQRKAVGVLDSRALWPMG